MSNTSTRFIKNSFSIAKFLDNKFKVRLNFCKKCNCLFFAKTAHKYCCNSCNICVIICKTCSKPFEVKWSLLKRRNVKFCSKICSRDTLFTKEKCGGKNHWCWKEGITLGNYDLYQRNYRKSVKDKIFYWRIKRSTNKIKNGGSHTFGQWEELKKKYNYMCLCCKRCEPEVKLTEDHIIPVSKGGKDDIVNIQPLCLSCNSRKNDKTIDYRIMSLIQKL